MRILKVILLFFAITSSFLGVRIYNMTRVQCLSVDKINQPPYILSEDKTLYFDDFSDKELIKYREFLEKYGINNIKNFNKKVIFITNLINNIHNTKKDTALAEYPKYVFIDGNGAYCQRSSILLSLMLSSISIYSRHWHASYQNNKGYHQFIEYYNPKRRKWIIVDAFYGVQYEKDGKSLSVEEVARAILDGNNIEDLIKVLDIDRLYYNAKEVESIWSNKLILARANDLIKYGKGDAKYGIWHSFPMFNRLPRKVKKLFRIFGRNNAMYEVFNFKKSRIFAFQAK